MMNEDTFDLGRWAVIDIETTGLDPNYDQIIDVGFLQYEGTKLLREYRSLVHSTEELSFFIQKLTGISSKMARKAPSWSLVEPEVMDLYGHHLIAHNAEFEKNFLEKFFDEVDDGEVRESYEDSLPFLALLFPWKSSLKLENFLIDWGIAESEQHRGLEDSIDLLKVLLVAVRLSRDNAALKQTINALFHKYNWRDYWYYRFFNLYDDQLEELAESIGLNLEKTFQVAKAFEAKNQEEAQELSEPHFSLDFSGKNIQKILRDGESVKKRIPFYQHRQTQEDLSVKVGQSFKNKVHSLVQAPTGTGKTLGYLLPAALFSMDEKQQILVATGTKTLQQQAIDKDVPQLRQLLSLSEDDLKVKRMVGSNNHLCELLFRQSIDEEDLLFSSKQVEEKFTDMYFELVFYHNSQSSGEGMILRDGLPYVFKGRIQKFRDKEKSIAVDFRSCTGQKCPYRNDCSYIKGLREAKDADIIIGNHALTFSWPRAFPRPQYIVLDEAHKIEDETTRAFTIEASQDSIDSFSKSLGNLQGMGSLFYLLAQNEINEGDSTDQINILRDESQRTYQMLQDHLIPLPDTFENYFKKHPRYTDQFWNELPMINPKRSNDQLGQSLFNHAESLLYILKSFAEKLIPYATLYDVKNMEDDNQIVAFTRFETFLGHLDDLVLALETVTELRPGLSHSLKYHEKQGYAFNSAPIDVGKMLHEQLLETSASVVYTSATLGNAEGDQGAKGIEWATGYSYLEPEKRFKKGFFLPSSYDYKNNTRVFLCDDTEPLYQATFVESTLKKVIPLIRDLGGQTLLLFSARKRFETAREVLLKEFDGEIPIFVQGMGANIVEDFKNSKQGILLGMESFGEGIDVPGETLQFVFIDKIPDLRMDLVINDRRQFYESQIGNEFADYYMAHRTRGLHQKLGRLMRRENDIGGVIIVDSRVRRWKGKTMEKMVKQMEPYELRRLSLEDSVEEVRKFILDNREVKPITDPKDSYQDHLNT